MSENDTLNLILAELKDIKYALQGFIAKAEAFQPDLEYKEPKETVEVSEEIIMDITIMAMTEKAVLAVKGGYQKWVPLSCIDNMQNEIGYELGSQYDLMLLPKKEWISKKAWDKFKPIKGGK